jgi:hypothetical protein
VQALAHLQRHAFEVRLQQSQIRTRQSSEDAVAL